MLKKLFIASLFSLLALFSVVSTVSAQTPTNTCSTQQPTTARVRYSSSSKSRTWVNGPDFTNSKPVVGDTVDLSCFGRNGATSMLDGSIQVVLPGGDNYVPGSTVNLQEFPLQEAGNYTITCSHHNDAQCTTQETFTVLPNASFTPQLTPSTSAVCSSLQVVSGNDSSIPARVTLRAQGSDSRGSIQGYRFRFGDGTQVETTNSEITHDYTISGTFNAQVEVKDSTGNYQTSNSCITEVRVKSSAVESHKSDCSDLLITTDNNGKVPANVKFAISGYDNKGAVQQYRIDLGNGVVKESAGRDFEQLYDRSGTYVVKAYVKDSNGNWVGGTNNCSRTMSIGSNQPLTRQPSTGTSTNILALGVGFGFLALGFEFLRRRQVA